ncbi:MAG: metallophosphoesterase family protein [Chloroflexi bacterium]|nr:metallophosphoesterase family protein [Chloroflexota bacterium]
MRYLIISDIHANLTAFETVLADAGQLGVDYDFVWCLGDVVGYGPDPNECVELLRTLPHLCLAGNHDWAALGRLDIRTFNADARKAVDWTRKTLTEENLGYLEALPITFVLEDFTLAHGSPREPVWEYILDPLIASLNFPHFQTDFCLVGHTHTPIIFRVINDKGESEPVTPNYNERTAIGNERHREIVQLKEADTRQIINPGSIGQPRDSDPRAAYAMLDTELLTWEFRRIPYDIDAVQDRMRQADLPDRLVTRLSHGW